ncbi:hypothetical protein LVJ94_29425 [Pendulispora rubella]|uniref:Glycosyltransferase RgtA/B/C/D-like domain-containing protein n=1 Tax=Pendulispora rubella TaxID=2741070 RepID=A0ABZ2KQU6_9BACT
MPTASKRGAAWPILAGVIIAIITWAKCTLIRSGPDLEPDAYGHALAARRMWLDPFDMGVHWVWLPLGHVMHTLSFALGYGMNGIRYANAIFTSCLCALLAACLTGISRGQGLTRRALPFLAAGILALSPIALVIGEAGALEPLFACLVLATLLAWRRGGAFGALLAGGFAAAAALLRYEGWVLPIVLFASWWHRGRTISRAVAWGLPGLAIGGYLYARASLAFVHENLVFARGFFESAEQRWPVRPHPLWMSLWYALVVPAIDLGPLVLFAMAGARWTLRRPPIVWRAALLAILAFLTVGFVARQHLGLLRHALSFAPLYATAAAAGILRVAVYLRRRHFVRRVSLEHVAFGLAGAALFLLAATRTLPTFVGQLDKHATGYQGAYRTAMALRERFTASTVVHCDETAVETLSELPPAAFVRWQMPDTQFYNLSVELQSGKRPLVVTTAERARHLRDRCRTLYEDGNLVILEYEGVALDTTARGR